MAGQELRVITEDSGIITGRIKHSSKGKWRALVLFLVHVAFAIHIAHWQSVGSTVTPVEPSEAMQTLELGLINAGFILFALLILSTLIFGRFFCGWGCHVVALQDLCGWILKKMGLRPKPIRSRLLVWVPLLAALYMFVWPSVQRMLQGRASPQWTWHLMTDDFWATFPNLPISLLTFFVCGFLIVYLLGNKGFCTYGCPYGGFFYHADKLAPGKIRVTDACSGCGHCTSVCTSNVRVHEEVKTFGMVVDAGCMKCLDCVSVCPNQALYFGFGKPAVAKGAPKVALKKAPKPYDFTWPEEIAMALVFLASLYAFRGLYDAIPFLLSLGLSAICAFWILHAARLLYRPQVRFQRFQLKVQKQVKAAGWGFAAFTVALLAFLGHSSVVQFHIHQGTGYLAEATRLQTAGAPQSEIDALAKQAREHLRKGVAIGWYPVSEYEYKLGVVAQALGDEAEARFRFEKALQLNSDRPNTRVQLAELYIRAGKPAKALAQWDAVAKGQADAMKGLWARYGDALAAAQRFPEAVAAYRKARAERPQEAKVAMNLGMLLAQAGGISEAEGLLRDAIRLDPRLVEARANLGLVLATQKRYPEAEKLLSEAVRANPSLGGAWLALGDVRFALQDVDSGLSAYREGLIANPSDSRLAGEYVIRAGDVGRWQQEREKLKAHPEALAAFDGANPPPRL